MPPIAQIKSPESIIIGAFYVTDFIKVLFTQEFLPRDLVGHSIQL